MGRFPPCPHCERRTHSASFCWFRPDAKCRSCNQMGHVDRVCKNKGKNQVQQAKVAEIEAKPEEKTFTTIAFSAESHEADGWLIDSGCTSHMCKNAELFRDLNKAYSSRVKVGNGAWIKVKGKGVVAVQTPSGTRLITDVLFVPEISQNLLSVGQMLEKNYTLQFKNKCCTIYEPSGDVLMAISMKDKVFPLVWKQHNMQAHAGFVDESFLWHKRLGHFSFSTLKYMHDKEIVSDSPCVYENSDVCGACQFGKQTRLPFDKSSWRVLRKLESFKKVAAYSF